MRRALTYLISLSMVSGSTCFAQAAHVDVRPTIDLKTQVPFSVIYSATDGHAVIGLTTGDGRIASFVDCEAPAGEPDAKLAIGDAQNCKEIEGSRFIYNQESVDRVNSLFPNAIKDLYESDYRSDHSGGDGGESLMFLMVGSLSGIGAMGLAGSANENFVKGSSLKGAAGALGAIGAAAFAVAMFIGFYEVERLSSGDVKIPSLESQMVASWQSLLKKNTNMTAIPMTRQSYLTGFELLRRAIVLSIMRANQA